MQPVKEIFNIDKAFVHLRQAVKPFPKAALFQLCDEGFDTPFEQLVACMISIRTLDETTVPTAQKLFATARTPEQMTKLTVEQIDELIGTCTFHGPKARQIHEIAGHIVREWNGDLPCDFDALTSLRGVGPKCANLVLGIACKQPRVGVDIHVHRVCNRWGYVATKNPEATLLALEEKLPEKYHVEINERLVPFGKHICTGKLPKCSSCPLRSMCQQVGVEKCR